MTPRTEVKEEFLAAAPGQVRFKEPMRSRTSFHIGGPAEVWAEPQDAQTLRRLLLLAAEAEMPVTTVGGGANLLVRDEGIPGLVVHLSGPGFQYFKQAVPGTGRVPGTDVLVGAALPLEWLIRRAQECSLGGVEFLAGVPGSVGGAVRMNAGTHDDAGKFHHMSDVLRSVRAMERDGQIRELPAEALGFGYRSSSLDGRIALQATLRFSPDDPRAISERVRRLWEFKKRTQDWSAPSVGCIFKNPTSDVIPAQAGIGSSPVSAGWMIDQAGLKGRRFGGAMVSPRHANFILNVDHARCSDVLALVEEAREKVLKQFGVDLELEVQLLP